jgi:uncharacterized protein (DUF433 family)
MTRRRSSIARNDPDIRVGTGIYARAEAARLLKVTPSRLRRWVQGYTYWYASHGKRREGSQPPVVQPDLPTIRGTIALSFIELMELRVVRALVGRGLSLQHVRRAANLASSDFGTTHPFAVRRVFTDGRSIFATLAADLPDLVELSRRGIKQIIAGGVLEPLLDEIDFDSDSALAGRWWPLGKQEPIVLDPRVAFGAPVVAGTRLRTITIAGMAHKANADAIARIYGIESKAVHAALKFEKALLAA